MIIFALPAGRRFMSVDGIVGGFMMPYVNATLPHTRIMRNSTSPTDPHFPFTKPYSVGYAGGEYQLQTFTRSVGFVNGQYVLALTINLNLMDSFEISDSSFSIFKNIALALADGVEITDTALAPVQLNLAFFDAIDVADVAVSALTFGMSFVDGLTIQDQAVIPGGDYTVYVLNTANAAVSTYRNWDFNSMAKIGDSYYAASSEGLFRLDGSSDDGETINASVLTQSLDFNTQQLKSMYYAMLGVAQNGALYLRVVHENNPDYVYRIVTSDEVMRNARVVFGKGMATRYWQFELVNENGADFELESITYYPVVLTRRITER